MILPANFSRSRVAFQSVLTDVAASFGLIFSALFGWFVAGRHWLTNAMLNGIHSNRKSCSAVGKKIPKVMLTVGIQH